MGLSWDGLPWTCGYFIVSHLLVLCSIQCAFMHFYLSDPSSVHGDSITSSPFWVREHNLPLPNQLKSWLTHYIVPAPFSLHIPQWSYPIHISVLPMRPHIPTHPSHYLFFIPGPHRKKKIKPTAQRSVHIQKSSSLWMREFAAPCIQSTWNAGTNNKSMFTLLLYPLQYGK